MRNIELRLVALPLVLILFRIFGTVRYIVSTLPCCYTASYSDNSDDIGSGIRLGICITDTCGQFIFHPLLMSLQVKCKIHYGITVNYLFLHVRLLVIHCKDLGMLCCLCFSLKLFYYAIKFCAKIFSDGCTLFVEKTLLLLTKAVPECSTTIVTKKKNNLSLFHIHIESLLDNMMEPCI